MAAKKYIKFMFLSELAIAHALSGLLKVLRPRKKKQTQILAQNLNSENGNTTHATSSKQDSTTGIDTDFDLPSKQI
ncbi:hypothetical protein ACMG4P_15585 [Pseudovibrio denitrificans]|uniref:hypothetical protein n=1 Tax=Pseudovibrio denitrificans TaxID=258256 RepID=UPI0039BF08D1